MVFGWLGRRNREFNIEQRQHVVRQDRPDVIYAIGDVHGRLDLLVSLEQRIAARHAAELHSNSSLIVMLGDYVDRGESSAGVIDHLLAPPPLGFERICLAGNHEAMMQAFLDQPALNSIWLRNGGWETLASYGLTREVVQARSASLEEVVRSHVPDEHAAFLAGLPLTLSFDNVVFVHAGLAPGVPVDKQREADVLWIRDKFLNAPAEAGRLVVHGHTPSTDPVTAAGRICVDTGAFATNVLTAVRIDRQGATEFISTKETAAR